jgi:hypothetical protein
VRDDVASGCSVRIASKLCADAFKQTWFEIAQKPIAPGQFAKGTRLGRNSTIRLQLAEGQSREDKEPLLSGAGTPSAPPMPSSRQKIASGG